MRHPFFSRTSGVLGPRTVQWSTTNVGADAAVLVAAPGTGRRIYVTYLAMSNYSTGDAVYAGLKFNGGGASYFKFYLPSGGGSVVLNLIQNEFTDFSVTPNNALAASLDVTNSPTIYYTVGYFISEES